MDIFIILNCTLISIIAILFGCKDEGKKIGPDGQENYIVAVVDEVAEVSVISNPTNVNCEPVSHKIFQSDMILNIPLSRKAERKRKGS